MALHARSSCAAGAVDYVRAVVGAAVPRAAYCASDHAADDKDDDDSNRGDPTSRAVPRGLLRDATTVLRQPFFAREGNGSRAVVIRGSGLPVWRIGRSAIAAFIRQTDVHVVAPLSNRKGGVNRVCRGLSEDIKEKTGSRGREGMGGSALDSQSREREEGMEQKWGQRTCLSSSVDKMLRS